MSISPRSGARGVTNRGGGSCSWREPGSFVRIRTSHSLRSRSPEVHAFRNCPPKECRKIITNGNMVFTCYDSVHILVSICLKVFQLPSFERNIEEVKKGTGPEHGKVYFNLRRRKKKREDETPDREGCEEIAECQL